MAREKAGPFLEVGSAGKPVETASLRICVITAAYPAPSEPTRAIFIENLCRELARLRSSAGEPRFELSVVAPRMGGSDPIREVRQGISLRRFRYPTGGKRLKEHARIPYLSLGIYLASGLRAALSEVRRRGAGAIHCHWVLPAGLIGALVSRMTGVPLVLHAHGSDIHRYARRSRVSRRLVAWILRRASRMLAVSADLGRILEEEFGVPGDRIRILPMGIDGAVFPHEGSRREARDALGLEDSRAALLSVGDLEEGKGILALSRALVRLESFPGRLYLAGDGPDRPALEELSRQAPDRLLLLGRLSPAELARWYRAADLLLLYSRGEGAPVSVMEAMASGLPVVSTAVGGVPELVHPGQGGWLVEPGAPPGEFLDVVKKALEEVEDVRAALGREGVDHTACRRAGELADLLEEVSSERGARKR